MPANPVDGNDTRRYSTARVWSGYGYDHPPTVRGGLSFRFHELKMCVSRDVQIADGRRWELWSPNSKIWPYLPGAKRGSYNIGIPALATSRRTDGHLGRFDPTTSPQYYCSDMPWLGYIKRAEKLTAAEIAVLPEYWPLHQHWDSDCKPARYSGRISTAMLEAFRSRNSSLEEHISSMEKVGTLWPLLWEARPTFPTSLDVELIWAPNTYEIAVDEVTNFQRGLKMKAAWVELARHRLEKGRKDIDDLRCRPVPVADDGFMGVWLNTASEHEALQVVIEDCIPGFFVHEYEADVDFPVTLSRVLDRRNPVCLLNFMEGTSIEFAFARDHNGFEELRKRFNGLVTQSVVIPSDAQLGPPFPLTTDDARRSSSWCNGGRSGLPGRNDPLPATKEVPPGDPSSSWVGTVPDSKSAASCAAPPIDSVVVAADRMPWERPPAIAVAAKKGSWGHWVEDTEESTSSSCFVYHGSAPQGFPYTRFDRHLKRTLHFEDIPASSTSECHGEKFGRPVPRWNFYTSNGHRRSLARASAWMYRSREPEKGDAGLVDVRPSPADLPLLGGLMPAPRLDPAEQSDYGEESDGDFAEPAGLQPTEAIGEIATQPVGTHLPVLAFPKVLQDVPMRSPSPDSMGPLINQDIVEVDDPMLPMHPVEHSAMVVNVIEPLIPQPAASMALSPPRPLMPGWQGRVEGRPLDAPSGPSFRGRGLARGSPISPGRGRGRRLSFGRDSRRNFGRIRSPPRGPRLPSPRPPARSSVRSFRRSPVRSHTRSRSCSRSRPRDLSPARRCSSSVRSSRGSSRSRSGSDRRSRSRSRTSDRSEEPVSIHVLISNTPEEWTYRSLRGCVQSQVEPLGLPLRVEQLFEVEDGRRSLWYLRLDAPRSAFLLRGVLEGYEVVRGESLHCTVVSHEIFRDAGTHRFATYTGFSVGGVSSPVNAPLPPPPYRRSPSAPSSRGRSSHGARRSASPVPRRAYSPRRPEPSAVPLAARMRDFRPLDTRLTDASPPFVERLELRARVMGTFMDVSSENIASGSSLAGPASTPVVGEKKMRRGGKKHRDYKRRKRLELEAQMMGAGQPGADQQ